MKDLTPTEIEAISVNVKKQIDHAWSIVAIADTKLAQHLHDSLQTDIKLNNALIIIQELMEMMDWVGTGDSRSALIEQQEFEKRLEELR